jgi:putative endonuclease
VGERGEELVALRYRRDGFSVLARNWHCREGELDLVVERDGLLVFCEVKTRTSAAFGVPAEAVTYAKQRKLRAAAARWLASVDGGAARRPRSMRFDVASVVIPRSGAPIVEVVESAF